MKMKLGLALAVMALLGAIASAKAAVVVDINDRPYYIHGPGYYVGPRYYVWVPGHWGVRHGQAVWIHGHYKLR